MPVFSAAELREMGNKIFQAAGAPEDIADRVTEHLVGANLMGHDSHGVIRIPQYIESILAGEIKPSARPEVVEETESTAIIDAGWGFGQYAAARAVEVAVEKAEQASISYTGVRRSNHIGRLGEYAEMMAAQDMIGEIMVNGHGAGQCAAPYGGRERRLSVNPMAYGIPTSDEKRPIVLDISSTVVAEGKVRVRKNRGEQLPEGWIIDSGGHGSTDPADLYGPPEGSLLHFGGYKGYGLAVIVDILAGALSGAGCSRDDVERLGNGTFIMAINIEALRPLDEFKREVERLVSYIKSSPQRPGFDEILMPYEPELNTREKRMREGVYVEDETLKGIEGAASEVGVELGQ